MTETTDAATPAPEGASKKRGGGLSSMLLADLKSMAAGLGVKGSGSMKKADLVNAIKGAQGGAPAPASADAAPKQRTRERGNRTAAAPASEQTELAVGGSEPKRSEQPAAVAPEAAAEQASAPTVTRRTRGGKQVEKQPVEPQAEKPAEKQAEQQTEPQSDRQQGQQQGERQQRQQGRQQRSQGENQQSDKQQNDKQNDKQSEKQSQQNDKQQNEKQPRQQRQQQGERQQGERQQSDRQQGDRQQGGKQNPQQSPNQNQNQNPNTDQADGLDGEDRDGSRNRRRRGRDRTERTGRQRNEPDTTILEDDVLVPAAGILDVLDNYAFVRTSGYTAGPEDVYLSLSMVRKFGLRRGDAIVGQVRQPREGERREKFNPMVRVDTVNGTDPEAPNDRADFAALTPVHPTERLRLETEPSNLIGRLIDLAAPLGKGQRGLVVAPAGTGRTTVLQSMANSVSANNPECHLMVVLLDERPEEVTDFQRSVKGEVIASTFDRPAGDHTMVAELAVERAKRLVELGHDVVVLLDGITRLGRAYNLSTTASGRPLRGGVDAAALQPSKQLFGAARNVEGGGSLTIVATASVDSGSEIDEAIFEEFTSAGNWELRLSADLAEHGVFPAIDIAHSSTRREELLIGDQELAIVRKLRRSVSGVEPAVAQQKLVDRLKQTHNNIDLLTQVQRSTDSH